MVWAGAASRRDGLSRGEGSGSLGTSLIYCPSHGDSASPRKCSRNCPLNCPPRPLPPPTAYCLSNLFLPLTPRTRNGQPSANGASHTRIVWAAPFARTSCTVILAPASGHGAQYGPRDERRRGSGLRCKIAPPAFKKVLSRSARNGAVRRLFASTSNAF